MKTSIGLGIDHRKAVIVTVSDKGEKTKVIESMVEKQPGRIAGVRSTTPFEAQKVQADNSKIEEMENEEFNFVGSIRDIWIGPVFGLRHYAENLA